MEGICAYMTVDEKFQIQSGSPLGLCSHFLIFLLGAAVTKAPRRVLLLDPLLPICVTILGKNESGRRVGLGSSQLTVK